MALRSRCICISIKPDERALGQIMITQAFLANQFKKQRQWARRMLHYAAPCCGAAWRGARVRLALGAQFMSKSSGKVTIKKYANRRLYDTESSSYITLDRLGAMIREGRDFEVIDAKSGDDITHQVLTQIIVEEESRGEGATMLPVNFLRQLIGLYGGQMQPAVPQYLEAAMDMFQKNHAAMREAVAVPFGGAGPTMFTDLAKRNMAMFQEAGRAFVPGVAPKKASAEDQPASEVDALRAELAALQAKVDKLGK